MSTENGHSAMNGTSINGMDHASQVNGVELEEELDLTEEVLDPHCDERSPQIINFNDVSAAAYRIKGDGGVEKTPCLVSLVA